MTKLSERSRSTVLKSSNRRKFEEETVENRYDRVGRFKGSPLQQTALFNFMCKRYGQFDELFSSRSTFSLSFPRSFSPLLFPSLPPRLIFSLSLPLDGATFHPSPRSSFRCKVHMRTRLGKTVRRGLISFRLRSSRRSENPAASLACNLRQR